MTSIVSPSLPKYATSSPNEKAKTAYVSRPRSSTTTTSMLWCVLCQVPTTVIVYAYLGWLELLSVLLLHVATVLRYCERRLAVGAKVSNEHYPKDEQRSSLNAWSLLLCAACFAYLTFVAAVPWEAALQFTAAVFVHCDHQREWTASHPSRLPSALELTVYICGLLAVCPALQADHVPLNTPIDARQYDLFCRWLLRVALFLKVHSDAFLLFESHLCSSSRAACLGQPETLEEPRMHHDVAAEDDPLTDALPEHEANETGRCLECFPLPSRANVVRSLVSVVSSLTLVWLLRHGLQFFYLCPADFVLLTSVDAFGILLLKMFISEFLTLFHFGDFQEKKEKSSTIMSGGLCGFSNKELLWMVVSLPIIVLWSGRIVWESTSRVATEQESHSSSGLATAAHPSAVQLKGFSCGLPLLVWMFSVGFWLLQECIVFLLRSPKKVIVSLNL